MNELAIEVRQAHKVFRKPSRFAFWRHDEKPGKPKQVVAVDRVSFDVRRGEIFGVLGPNGSGKSTLVRLVATLLLPDGGALSVFGHDVVKEPMAVQRLINRVSVEASFFKKLSPMENLLFGARLYALSERQARERILSLLRRLGIERQVVTQPVEEMSRGMQQKVAIVRALLTRPAVLLLDEPTTGLDPRSKREVQALVQELREQDNTTILLTTHDMVEAETLCDRIAIMDAGKIVAMDTPEGLRALVPPNNGTPPTLEDVFLELTGKKLKEAAAG
ncbi:MAG: ABC transporter ATP-binding protein [Anaerolineales bacterium]|jgi:ABC-2 type transport system ATP-binding protein